MKRLTLEADAPVVELFEGVKQGVFRTRLVPEDEFSAKVFITNTAEQVQTVQLPKAAVGVHVLKQQLPFPPTSPASPLDSLLPGESQTGNGQPVGGTFSPAGSGSNQLPFFNNSTSGSVFFSIPPETTVQLEFHSVCLEYGKRSPHSRMRYVLVPLEEAVDDAALRRLLESYDPEKVARTAMQAAAWHLSGGMSWRTLATRRRHRIGLRGERLFTLRELKQAYQLVEEASRKPSEKTTRRARTARQER